MKTYRKMLKSALILALSAFCALFLMGGCAGVSPTGTVAEILKQNPQVTKIETKIRTGELTSSGVLRIAAEGEAYVAEYRYSIQSYAEIGDAAPNERIKTESGVEYYRDGSIGELTDGAVEWKAGVEGLAPAKFGFEEQDLVADSVEFTDGSYKAKIKSEASEAVFGKPGLGVVSIAIEIDEAAKRVDSINFAYEKGGIPTEISIGYGYDPEIVSIP